MDRKAVRESVESLQNILIARATGGPADEIEYRTLRDTLMNEPTTGEQLPSFVRTSRDLSQFWAYIKKQSGQYRSRREHIWQAFNPLLDALDGAPESELIGRSTSWRSTPRKPPKPRVFISYSTADKAAAGAVKHAIADGGFECFLAHDTLQVSEDWRERILDELKRCDIFVALLSVNFKKSAWAPQEIGVIVSRAEVPVVPLSLDDTLPFGFISHI